MGGFGSGRPGGFATLKTTDYRKIDLPWLNRRGILRSHASSTITWSRGGHRTGSISVACREEGLRVMYTVSPHNGAPFQVDEIIPWAWTDTAFGGRRRWFRCPRCKDRCATIYGGAYFRCRACHGLQHASKYEPAYDRAMERANRMRERLGDTQCTAFDFDELPPKPKRMRWTTYKRLEADYAQLQRRWKVGVIRRFAWGGGR